MGQRQWLVWRLRAVSENDALVKNGTVLIDKNPALLKKGKYPVIQQAKNGDPNPGYYVSQTSRKNGPDYLQSSYVDASQVAFGALSGGLKALGFSLETHPESPPGNRALG
jgi:hypothetical protein